MRLSLLFLLIFLFHCELFFSCISDINTPDKIRVILDTDANNELDDQHAIAYMLFNRQIFDVEGITINRTQNGGSIEEHYQEAERIVKLCDRYPEVKIFKGASGSYDEIADHIDKPGFDGSAAVEFIIEQARKTSDRKLVLLPVGKLTNIALALKKDPSIIPNIRVVWLGTNYPDSGEYNFVNDISSVEPVIASGVEFEMVTVRYGQSTGTSAVSVTVKEIQQKMTGNGPHIGNPVTGRHGGEFSCFGDYSVELFTKFEGNPVSRALFDVAAVAIVKNPAWAERVVLKAPKFVEGKWIEQPQNTREIVIWENFKRDDIIEDFYKSISR
jgi:inosine-uridine nucleoside N-ribohydrolase